MPVTPPPAPKFRALLLAPPQGEEAMPPTRREERKPRRDDPGAGDSHIRLRAAPRHTATGNANAQDFLDQIGDEQLNLTVELLCLRRAIDELARHPRGQTLARALTVREAMLTRLRDALECLYVRTATRRLHPLFLDDGPLADYLRGLYAWLHAAIRAFDQLVDSIRTGQPDWALLRWRLGEARAFHFPDLDGSIRGDVKALAVVTADVGAAEDASGALEPLFAAARELEAALDAPLA
jgi:hypothetical protein